MRIPPSLASIDGLDIDALAIFLPKKCLPLTGFLSLLDWRLCFGLSDFLHDVDAHSMEKPVLFADFEKLKFGRLFIFFCDEELECKKKLDAKILLALKVLSSANLANFALAFPDEHPWIFEHWQNHYENHTIFKNISIIDRFKFI
jgi:hypothetical protein